jgi:hypothetical protein
MGRQKSQAGGHGHGWTEIPAHGINSNPDHEAIGAGKVAEK